MSQLNRRNALALVASLPALAVPAVAAAAPSASDPIFAAIEAHRIAYDAHAAAIKETAAAFERLPAKFRGYVSVPVPINVTSEQLDAFSRMQRPKANAPRAEIKAFWERLSAPSDGDLEFLAKMEVRLCTSPRSIREAVATNQVPESTIRGLVSMALRQLRSEQTKFRRASRHAGLTQAEARQTEACHADADTARAMFQTIPTTLAGMLALLRYIVECNERGDDFGNLAMSDDGETIAHDVIPATLMAALEKLTASV